MEWLLTRSRSTIETPLEEEISQLRAELERRDQEQIDPQSSIENPEGTEEEDGDSMDLGGIIPEDFSSLLIASSSDPQQTPEEEVFQPCLGQLFRRHYEGRHLRGLPD